MNAEFEALKERFKKKVENSGKKQQFNTDIYPHWNIDFGDEVILRILRDSDETNENVFYVEKCIHTLAVNGKDRNVTCIEKHFGEKCPICELSRKYYTAKDKDNGIYYYNKKKYLLKALVIKDPLPADAETKENAENKVKVFQLNKKLLDKILIQMANELDAAPWDLKEGYNFRIRKMKGDGGNPDYLIDSGFVRKATAIDESIVAGLEPTNLAGLLPNNPTLEFVQRLLNSHLTGDDDTGTAGDHDDDGAKPASAPAQAAKVETPKAPEKVGEAVIAQAETKVEEPKVEAAKETSGSLDEDEDAIFQRILARKNAAKTAA